MGKNTLDLVAMVLVIVGAVNWGLVALDRGYDLVSLIFGEYSSLARIVYGLVGLSGLYIAYMLSQKKKKK